MCGVFGLVSGRGSPLPASPLLEANAKRGRDAWGLRTSDGEALRCNGAYAGKWDVCVPQGESVIGNLRAEPTTEVVSRPAGTSDIQPYKVGDWAIVHNGTIANDKGLIERFDLSPETTIDSWVIAGLLDAGVPFRDLKDFLQGSYAILAQRDGVTGVRYLCNYRPLYQVFTEPYNGQALSSVPLSNRDVMVEPYTFGVLLPGGHLESYSIRPGGSKRRTLVVHSGGLDSTVAAAELKRQGHDISLLHMDYECRAAAPEREAVKAVANALDVPYQIVDASFIKHVVGGSNLTGTGGAEIAGGVAGAEYAHEWVPARNLMMLSIAIGCAESWGFDGIALGANLEEAGAYPDNEPEFLERMKAVLPFAVGDGVRMAIHTPVGNLMKHEIVRLGLENGAPMEATWSCYHAGETHCGECGPCYMRRQAFLINGSCDPVFN